MGVSISVRPRFSVPIAYGSPIRRGRWPFARLVWGAASVRGGSHQMGPLDVEEVRNATAGRQPQDCELTAGKRLIARVRREHPQMALIVLGDDLYSHVPFVTQLQQLRLHYVLVAKPSSHPTLMAAVAAAETQGGSQQGQWEEGSGARRRTYTYRIVRQLP